MPAPAAALKSCCVRAYESEWARLLAGASWHPGGVELTLHMARQLGITRGTRVLDVASGAGASALALAQHFECDVAGIDLGERNVAAAREAAAAARVTHLARFDTGDAERLAVASGWADVVLCECALCTFPDKDAAVREMVRAVRPGGFVAISDLTLEGPLPAEVQSLVGWVACLAGAVRLDDYVACLRDAGLAVEHTERHDDALHDLLGRLRTALLAVEIGARLRRIAVALDEVETAKRLLRSAREAADSGTLGYAVIIGRRPQ